MSKKRSELGTPTLLHFSVRWFPSENVGLLLDTIYKITIWAEERKNLLPTFVGKSQADEKLGPPQQPLELVPAEQAVVDDEIGKFGGGFFLIDENGSVNFQAGVADHLVR